MSHIHALKTIGLSEKEIKIYLTLLKSGRATPSTLSKITKINRPTVYSIAKELLSKGIIAEDLAGKTLYLAPLPPDNLIQLIERQRRDLDEKEDLIQKTISDLHMITADKNYPVPKIQFIEENRLKDFLYENTKKWNRAIHNSDFTWWGFQDHSLVEEYEDWIISFSKEKEYIDPRVKTKLLSNASFIERKMEKKLSRQKRDIRFVEGMNFTSSMWVAADYLIMIVTKQHPFYLFEIHDATLAHNMREIFKKLWAKTEPGCK